MNVFLRIINFQLFRDWSCEAAEGQTHEDAVEPYLIGVDGFMPEYTVGLGAWLVVQLGHQQLHGLEVLGLWPLLVHAGNEMTRADVVEVILLDVVATDGAVATNHRVGVLLAVESDVLATIF